MDNGIIDDEDRPLARTSVLPGERFFIPNSVEDERTDREVATSLTGTETIAIADPDADGLACVALLRAAFGEVALVAAGPHEFPKALARVAAYAEPETTAFICDLCPDDREDFGALGALTERATVRWFDHHQWDDALTETVHNAGVDLVVGDSERECSADVTLRSLDVDLDAQYADLVAVTRDHDLWLREDPRSDDLADYAHWADPEAFVETVVEHGPDLPEDVREYLAERRIEKDALIERAVERAAFETVGPWTVALTYGRCSQNEVAEALREQGADASVIVKPAGSASVRGSEGFERCHEVARQVGGGGHPKAAGCKPDVYDDMLDYAHHWTTRGAVTKRVILSAFERLLEAERTDGDETDESRPP